MLSKTDNEVIMRYIKQVEVGFKADIEEARADYLEFRDNKTTRYVLHERISRIQDTLDFIEDLKDLIDEMEERKKLAKLF